MHIDNYNDAIRIYNHALIRINSELVYVKTVRDDMDIIGVAIRSGKEVQVNVNSEAIDRHPIRTGFVNGFGSVVYVTRKTARTYSQGLTHENMKVRVLLPHHNGAQLIDEVQRMRYVGLCDMADGSYPSIDEAISMMRNNKAVSIVAFERNKAIDEEHHLWYRESRVGKYDIDAQVVKLRNEFKHLNWVFEQKCE